MSDATEEHLADPGPPEDVLAAMIEEALASPGRHLSREEIGPWIRNIGRQHDEDD